jgi:hypothetical protein
MSETPPLRPRGETLESLDFEELFESRVHEENRKKHVSEKADQRTRVKRWLLTAAVAVVTALVAFFIVIVTHYGSSLRLYLVKSLIAREVAGELVFGIAYIVHVCLAVGFVAIGAAICAFVEPVAGMSMCGSSSRHE